MVECKFHIPVEGKPDVGILRILKYEVQIEDDVGNRLWIEHPNGHAVDIAAFRLPIQENGGFIFCCLNEINYETRWQPTAASDAFIVGFPEGVVSANETPIWKRASIASEPELGYDGDPVFLVDTVGNKGLSGSPVVGVRHGLLTLGSGPSAESAIGSWKNFIGVYAGRLSENGIGSQLGRVWKAHLLEELFSHISTKRALGEFQPTIG